MALVECRECKQSISDQAEACPHCGYPVKPRAAAASSGSGLPLYIKVPLGIVGGLVLLGILIPTPKRYAPPASGGSVDAPNADTAACIVGKWTWEQSSIALRVEGTITNPSGFRKISLQVEDANGNLLGTDTAYLDAIGSWRISLLRKTSPTDSIKIRYACD